MAVSETRRALPSDFSAWTAGGLPGWSPQEVLQAYRDLESADSVRVPLHWARVNASGFAALAGQAGLTVREIWHRADRWFAHAIRPSTSEPDPVAV